MSIPVSNKLVNEVLDYLQSQDDDTADNLYHELLEEKIGQEKEELKVEGTLPNTRSGSWIVE